MFLTFGVLILLALGLLGFLIGNQVERNQLRAFEERLKGTALLIREVLFAREEPEALRRRLKEISEKLEVRITLIGPAGQVLGESDSDPEDMDNHGERPEISQARQGPFGLSIRFSTTVQQEMMYVALGVREEPGGVAFVRVGLPLTDIRGEVAGLQRLVWLASAVTAVLALGLAFWLARRLVRPLEELTRGAEQIAAGAYGLRIAADRADEVGLLARAFNHMSERLAEQFARLDEDRQQLRTVLSSMVEGVVAVDMEERVLFANERAGHLLDFTVRHATGRRLWEMVRLRPLHEILRLALHSPGPVQKELSWTGPGARTLLVHAAQLPGLPARGVLLVLHDTTELRRLEHVRQEFVANVSHELKTPLAVIQACIETLLDGAAEDPEARGRFLERIADQGQRLHYLILDLLHLARIESETQVFTMEELPLERVVIEALEKHRPLAEGRRQQLEIISPSPGQDPVVVWADEEAVGQILDNLVNNALKYTHEGGRVQVSWGRNGPRAFLRVEDTGIGITETDLPRVFERFYRVDRARSRELGGTGLGLAIVKHLAQAMQGSVQASSRPNEGSCFTVFLPLPGTIPGGDAPALPSAV